MAGLGFEQYRNAYSWAALSRDEGVLEIRLHTDDGPFVFDEVAHRELGRLFRDVADDRDNRVVILTGTGDSFCEQIAPGSFGSMGSPTGWDDIFSEGRRMISALLDIEAPVIAAMNGPCRIHSEIPVLSDIVIAAESCVFQDAPHYMHGVVPGDGANIAWLSILGPNRGRYFLMTGEELSAREAQRLGVVGEVLPADQVLPRARELATSFARNTDLMLRYSRLIMTHEWREKFAAQQGYGLMMSGHAIRDLMAQGADLTPAD